jgi:hypothetical protein
MMLSSEALRKPFGSSDMADGLPRVPHTEPMYRERGEEKDKHNRFSECTAIWSTSTAMRGAHMNTTACEYRRLAPL